jgi:3-ketosteroid 9alpha-monooxygenase subunit B
VTVVDVIAETPDSCSLVLAESFDYRPGQFLTFRVPHDERGSVSRCYSLSSAPQTDRRLAVTVKRVPGGHASNWICDNVRPGSTVQVLPPAGSFTPESLDDDLLLLAGGSGITPVFSIIKAALAEGSGHLALFYANRNAPSVIFGDELADLARRHPDRLRVEHWLDQEHGYPTAGRLAEVAADYPGRDAFVCGPAPFMAIVEQVLSAMGTPSGRVHIERFTVESDQGDLAEAREPSEQSGGAHEAGRESRGPAMAQVELDGQVHQLAWPVRKRLLDVLIEAGLNPPYSCRQGNCGACMLRLLDGEVELVHNEILEAEDFADGYTLACQAVPRSEHARFSYAEPP